MSTRYDINAAKAKHAEHVGSHKCTKLNLTTGLYFPCDIRRALWLAWMATAARWGLEADDDARQRRQYAELRAA